MQDIATAQEQAQAEGRLGAFLDELLPEIERQLQEQTATGADIAELVAMVSDGTGDPRLAPLGRCAVVLPRALVRGMAPAVRDIEAPAFADLIERPRAGTFLIMVASFEGRPGFAAYGYESAPTAPLFRLQGRQLRAEA